MSARESYLAWHRFFRLQMQNVFEQSPPQGTAPYRPKLCAAASLRDRLSSDELLAVRRRLDIRRFDLWLEKGNSL